MNPATGEVWREGDLISLPTLANTLDIIGEEGPEAIHNGSLTSQLVQDIQSFGGIITEDDLRNYRFFKLHFIYLLKTSVQYITVRA